MPRKARNHDDEDDGEILEGRYLPREAMAIEAGRVIPATARLLHRPVLGRMTRFATIEIEFPERLYPVVGACNGQGARFFHGRDGDGWRAFVSAASEVFEIRLPDGRRLPEGVHVVFNTAAAKAGRMRRGEVIAREPLAPLGDFLVYALGTRDRDGRFCAFFVGSAPCVPGVKPAEAMRQGAASIYALQPEIARHVAARVRAGEKRAEVQLVARCHGADVADILRWQIVRLMREGQPVENFRLMTTPELAALGDQLADERIAGVEDLARHRERTQRRQARAETLLDCWAAWRARRMLPSGSDTQLQIRLSRSFPVLWRRLVQRDALGQLDLPLPDLDADVALAMLVEQARAGRRPLPLRYPEKLNGTGTHG